MVQLDMAYDAPARTIANLVPVVLAYWDTSQRCVFANRAYEQWFDLADVDNGVVKGFAVVVTNISERKRLADKLQAANETLADALAQVATLRGLLPVCAWCRRARDDEGCWDSLDAYLARHTQLEITHGLCDSCLEQNFPDAQASGDL